MLRACGLEGMNEQEQTAWRRTRAPAVLIEVAFHDNPQDAQFIMDHIYEIGVAIAKGILEYFGIPYREDTPENINYLKNKYNGK